jgi:transcriptional regulator with XRE-family HTH domain
MGFAERLSALMAERGATVRGLARRVPCDPALVSKLKNGRQRPSAQTARRLDEVLGAGGELTELATNETRAPATTRADSSIELIELMRQAESSDLGSGTIEALQVATDRLCRDYPTAAAPLLVNRSKRHLGYVTGLLNKRPTLRQHRELLVIGGWLAALLACVSYDAGDPAAAEIARRMTRQFGEHADHGELVAWSFETAAWFALVEGRFADAVALSEAGIEHAGLSNAGVQLHLQAARGYARMGDSRAQGMLAAGRVMLSRLPESVHPENHFMFDQDKYEFYAATIYTWLGSDDKAADEHARWVVHQCRRGDEVRWPMRLANSEVDLALLASRRGDLDQAVALGRSALGFERRSAQLFPRAFELERVLVARYPHEKLTGEYREMLRGEIRALPSAGLGWLDAVVRRHAGTAALP